MSTYHPQLPSTMHHHTAITATTAQPWSLSPTSGLDFDINNFHDNAKMFGFNPGFCGSGETLMGVSSSLSADQQHQDINESFPCKLHSMLSEIESQGLAHIVSWQPHGRSFVVHKRKSFVELIMPIYFRMSKFASFQRQLNIYGFNRITTGRDKGGYYHKLFLRGQRDLTCNIARKKIKGTGVRKPANPETEPNFYLMPSPLLSETTTTNNITKTPSSTPQATIMGLAGLVDRSLYFSSQKVSTSQMTANSRNNLFSSMEVTSAMKPEMFTAMLNSKHFDQSMTSMTDLFQPTTHHNNNNNNNNSNVNNSDTTSRRFSLFSSTFDPLLDGPLSSFEPIAFGPQPHQQHQQPLLQHEEMETSYDAIRSLIARLDTFDA